MESFSQNLNINLQMEVDRSIAQILFFLEKHMYTHTQSKVETAYYFSPVILQILCKDYPCISQLIKIITII